METRVIWNNSSEVTNMKTVTSSPNYRDQSFHAFKLLADVFRIQEGSDFFQLLHADFLKVMSVRENHES